LRFGVDIAASTVIVDPSVLGIAVEQDDQSRTVLLCESVVRGTPAWKALHAKLISIKID
jgi:hypothetical protein